MFIKRVFQGALLHAVILWVALALSYNSYKEIMREHAPLERAVKDSIKETFPWATALFVLLYLSLMALSRRDTVWLNTRGYVYAVAAYGISVNVLFYRQGKAVLTSLNGSTALAALVFITASWAMAAYRSKGALFSILRPQAGRAKKVREWVLGNLSLSLIAAFVFIISACGVLLTFNEGTTARGAAQYAFLALAAGVAMELYGVLRGKSKN